MEAETLVCPKCFAELKSTKSRSLPDDKVATCKTCSSKFTLREGRHTKPMYAMTPPPPPQAFIPSPPETTICPFCAEEVKADAIKCRHCGEPLTQEGQQYKRHIERAMVQGAMQPKWSPLVALLLSLFIPIPGIGQVYKGQVAAGLVWFVMTVICYFLCLIPGAVLHLVCIIDATVSEPR